MSHCSIYCRKALCCQKILVLSLGLIVFGPVAAEQPRWTKFQNGGRPSTAQAVLPTQWSPKKNIAWTAEIEGYGQSTPVIAGDQIVVTSTSGENKDDYHVSCFAVESGEKLWQVTRKNPSPFKNTPMVSRAAPTAIATDHGFIAFFEGGIVIALDTAGEVIWEKNLVDEYGEIKARHGLSASLEQDETNIFVWVERTDNPYVLALEKATGKETWKVQGAGSTSWSSPRLIPVGEGQHLVCSAGGKIFGLAPADGERLWEFDEIANNRSCTPMPAGDGQFLIGASEGRGEASAGSGPASNGLIKITQQDDGKFTASYKWQAKKATSSFGSPVVAGDTAAIVNRAGVLYRLNLETGEQVSVARTDAGGIWATPIVNGDLIYLFGYKGTTSVISLADGKQVAENRCWEKDGESDESSSGNVLYAATPSPPYLFIRRGDKLFAIKDK